MSDKLSKKLRQLNDFLLSEVVGDNTMLLSELDGFLAGLIVCPEMIMPSEWMAVVWGDEAPVFDSVEQAQAISDLIMGHYNDIIRQLDRNHYSPIYDTDIDDIIMWETWIEGFVQAARLRPDAWRVFALNEDADLQRALFVLGRLKQLATIPTLDIKPLDMDEELENLVPDLIPAHVEVLHRARLAQAKPPMLHTNENRPKVGRNELCPCGSGKKFKSAASIELA